MYQGREMKRSSGNHLALNPDECGKLVIFLVTHTKRPIYTNIKKIWNENAFQNVIRVTCNKDQCKKPELKRTKIDEIDLNIPILSKKACHTPISIHTQHCDYVKSKQITQICTLIERQKVVLMKKFYFCGLSSFSSMWW